MYKGKDGWVPFDEMMTELEAELPAYILAPRHNPNPRVNVEGYIRRRVEQLRLMYIGGTYGADDRVAAMAHAQFLELRAIAEFLGIYVEDDRNFLSSRKG